MTNWGNEEFLCTECGAKFNTKWTLKRHSVKHQQDTTSIYNCSKCNKLFSRKDSLDRHQQMSHSNTFLMYICSVKGCGRLFSFKSTFQRHKCSHTQCYKCEECGSSFSRKDNLSRHKTVHLKKLSNHSKKPVDTKTMCNLEVDFPS